MIKQLAKESVLFGASKFLVAGIGFITVPFFTRIFTLEQYGILSEIAILAALMPILYGLSLETAYTRYFNDKKWQRQTLFQVIFKFQLVYGIGILVIGLIFSRLLLEKYNHLNLWPTIGLVLASSLVSQFVTIFLMVARMRHETIKYLVICTVSNLFGAGSAVLFVYLYPTLISYFLGGLVGSMLAVITAIRVLGLPMSGVLCVPMGQFGILLRFSIPLIPAAIATYLNSSLDRLALAYYFSAESVAIYTIGFKVASVASMGISVVVTAFMPHSMKLIEVDKTIADMQLERILRLFSILACSGVVFLQLIAPTLIGILAPVEYAESYKIVGILAVGAVFFGYTYFSSLGSWKAEKSSDYAFTILLGVLVNLLLNYYLVPLFGIVGAAVATACGMFINVICSFYISHKRHPFGYSYIKLVLTNLATVCWLLLYSKGSDGFVNGYHLDILSGVLVIAFVLLVNIYSFRNKRFVWQD